MPYFWKWIVDTFNLRNHFNVISRCFCDLARLDGCELFELVRIPVSRFWWDRHPDWDFGMFVANDVSAVRI